MSAAMSALGLAFFAALTLIRFKQAYLAQSWTFTALSLMLAVQAGTAAILYIRRTPAEKEAEWWVQLLAWLSALMPMLMQPSSVGDGRMLLPLPGLALALWGMLTLDRSFAVTPAKRKLVSDGPYRVLRHPIYTGEILSLAGIWLGAVSWWNGGVLLLFMLSLVWRIKKEEELLCSH